MGRVVVVVVVVVVVAPTRLQQLVASRACGYTVYKSISVNTLKISRQLLLLESRKEMSEGFGGR